HLLVSLRQPPPQVGEHLTDPQHLRDGRLLEAEPVVIVRPRRAELLPLRPLPRLMQMQRRQEPVLATTLQEETEPRVSLLGTARLVQVDWRRRRHEFTRVRIARGSARFVLVDDRRRRLRDYLQSWILNPGF